MTQKTFPVQSTLVLFGEPGEVDRAQETWEIEHASLLKSLGMNGAGVGMLPELDLLPPEGKTVRSPWWAWALAEGERPEVTAVGQQMNRILRSKVIRPDTVVMSLLIHVDLTLGMFQVEARSGCSTMPARGSLPAASVCSIGHKIPNHVAQRLVADDGVFKDTLGHVLQAYVIRELVKGLIVRRRQDVFEKGFPLAGSAPRMRL